MSEIYPKVFFYHLDGGHIYRGKGVPKHTHNGNPSPFMILPLNENNDVVDILSPINTRAEYIQSLTSWKRVAIKGNEGMFLSCGKYLLPTKSAQAWYKKKIGESEQFEVEHCPTTGTFSFKSYNGLYLHYNPYFGTVAFKTREANEASWHVHPLNLVASDSEQILFVGVVSKEKQFLIQRTAEGVANEWKVDLNLVLNTLIEGLKVRPEGSCSMFQHPLTQHQ